MAGIQTAVRYVLIALGVITLALAVILAIEGEWWAALPGGGFGVGVAVVAYVSLREERQELSRPNVASPAAGAPAARVVAMPPPQPPAPPAAAPSLPKRRQGGRR